MTHILWLIIKNNLSILDEEEIKDILGEYYVGINSHRRAPAGGAIAPRPGWRHFTIMSHRLQKWLYIATCWHYLFHWPDFARDSLILEFLNFCIFNKYWPMIFLLENSAKVGVRFPDGHFVRFPHGAIRLWKTGSTTKGHFNFCNAKNPIKEIKTVPNINIVCCTQKYQSFVTATSDRGWRWG